MGTQGQVGFADQLMEAMRESDEYLDGNDVAFKAFKECADALDALTMHFKKNGKWGAGKDAQFEIMDALRDIFEGQYDPALFEGLDDEKMLIDGVYQWSEDGEDTSDAGAIPSSLALGILCLDGDRFLTDIDEHLKTIKKGILEQAEIEEDWTQYLEDSKGRSVEEAIDEGSDCFDGWGSDDVGSIDDTRDVIVSLMKISNQAYNWLNQKDERRVKVNLDVVKEKRKQLIFLSELHSSDEVRGAVEVFLLMKLHQMKCNRRRSRDGERLWVGNIKYTVDIGVTLLSYLRSRENDNEFELSLYDGFIVPGEEESDTNDDTKLSLGDYSYSPVRKFIDWRSKAGGKAAATANLMIECIDAGYDPVRVALYNIQCWLLEIQNNDGGWGETHGAESNLDSTSRVLYLLGDSSKIPRSDVRERISRPINPSNKSFILPNPLLHSRKGDWPLKHAAEFVIEQSIHSGGWESKKSTGMDPKLTARIVGGLSYAIEDHKPPLYMDDLLRICARSAVADAFKERYSPKLNRIEFNVKDGGTDGASFSIEARVERAGLQGLSWTSTTNEHGRDSHENMEGFWRTLRDLAGMGVDDQVSKPMIARSRDHSWKVDSYNPNNVEERQRLSIQLKQAGKNLHNYVRFFDQAWVNGQALSLVTNRNDIPWELMYNGEGYEAKTNLNNAKSWGYLGLDMQIGRKIPTKSKIARDTEKAIETRAVLNDGKLTVLLVAPCDPYDLDGEEECNQIEETILREIRKLEDYQAPDIIKIYGSEATKKKIIDTIHDKPIDIFHFSGHGFDNSAIIDALEAAGGGGQRETYLVCHTEADDVLEEFNEDHMISPEDLTHALHGNHGPPSLVFLNACDAGKLTPKHDRTLITDCLQAGVPAVVAMTFPILDEIATRMGAHIYKSYLIERETIGEACRQARRDIHKEYDEVSLWGPLALFGDPTARFFELT